MKRVIQLISYLTISFSLCYCKSESTLDNYTKEKILIVGNSNEPAGLDPQVVTGVIESTIIRATNEGLCVEDPVDATIHRPGAASSWTANEDYTEWVFKLQKDGKWSDGEPVTAEDFVFSYHRMLSPSFGAKYSSMLYYMEGAEDYNKDHRDIYLVKNSDEFKDSWEELKEINFRGAEGIDLKQFESKDFADLSKEEKITYIKGSGLNRIEKPVLTAVKDDTSLFTWPENVETEMQQAVLRTYLANHGKDLWDLAGVGITAIDDHTIKINLRSSILFLPDLTKHYTWYPVPKHVVLQHGTISERRTKWTEPENFVSNGPFKMKTWKFNYKIEVDRNPYYWDYDSVKLNGVVFLPISNTYTEARMFYNDQLHTTYSLAPELIEYSAKNFPQNTRQETYLGTNFLRFNNNQEGLDDINVRKAIAYATDSESLIKYVLKGGQQVATGIVPPMGKYDTTRDFGYDPEKAKEYLAKTKYADNPSDLKIILLTTDKEGAKTVAEALQAMWLQELGIDVKIEQREWASYQTRMSKLDYGIATGGWIGDYPDPTTFLDIWKKGDGNNRTGWSSQAYEDKLKQAEKATDPLDRIQKLQEAEAIYMNDMPIVPLYWYTSNYLHHESVKNWHPKIMKNQPYKFIDLEN
ncbi:MAG: peptide ABC transporter substrate-binding protein [Akkermansiaceae bacterium]